MSEFTIPPPVGTNWTLLFKFHKTTIVLPIEPTENFLEVKSKLYTALTMTPGLESINGTPLPSSADQIELAIPKKAGDVYSGWQSIEVDEDDEGKPSKGKDALKNCPKGVGLKEGSVLAFRFGHAIDNDEWPVKIPSYDEHDQVRSVDGDVPGLAEAMKSTTGAR